MAEPGRQGQPPPLRAAAAPAAAGCILAGTAAVTIAVLAGPGPGFTGYVSEAGIAGSGHALTYRIGVYALAAGVLLLAAALPARLWMAAALLGAGSLSTALSGTVTCSVGCPLPPFERATVGDLVHGGASIAATGTIVLAMVAVALHRDAGRRLRGLAAGAAAVALPLCAAVGLAMLLVGRGSLVGVLERVVLAVAVLWGVATATVLGFTDPPAPPVRTGGASRTGDGKRHPPSSEGFDHRRPPS
ncbi:DUF998 domain-containing protein [Micromonospora sp. 15K316]|uniref:DUF998 domain-containing protein n=1 Tax=Micromonospora sp. 15K316 TaxID=2530376 RepID=UPI00104DA64C|nr:DUF998 domain-containing protein [Micromonospora sp. 15K316]TDC25443.1 DUF998 domain-containing protein [Micromonospora sp. 15K316]